jgi:hypothetical protein
MDLHGKRAVVEPTFWFIAQRVADRARDYVRDYVRDYAGRSQELRVAIPDKTA